MTDSSSAERLDLEKEEIYQREIEATVNKLLEITANAPTELFQIVTGVSLEEAAALQQKLKATCALLAQQRAEGKGG